MNTIVLFNTYIGSLNLGDEIIVNSVFKELNKLLRKNFVLQFPTHTPCFHFYQIEDKNRSTYVQKAKYKFICGTDLLENNLLSKNPLWNINLFDSEPLSNTILIGVGTRGGYPFKNEINDYTKKIYNTVLSKEFIHSVRDSIAKNELEKIGLKCIETGCPSLWRLNEKHCAEIPKHKSDKVILSLTRGLREPDKDQLIVDILKDNYKKIFFWIQSPKDIDYLYTLKNTENIETINPNLEYFSEFLKSNNIDYIGTRLHGGIFAMWYKKRTIIISTDKRASNFKYDHNIPCVDRNEINNLHNLINSNFETNIKL